MVIKLSCLSVNNNSENNLNKEVLKSNFVELTPVAPQPSLGSTCSQRISVVSLALFENVGLHSAQTVSSLCRDTILH